MVLLLASLMVAGACGDRAEPTAAVVELAPVTAAPVATIAQPPVEDPPPTSEVQAEPVATPSDETAEILTAAEGIMAYLFDEDRQAGDAALEDFATPDFANGLGSRPLMVGLGYQFEDHWLVEVGTDQRKLHTCVNLLPGLEDLNDSTIVASYVFHAVRADDRWLIASLDTGAVSTFAECRAGNGDESATPGSAESVSEAVSPEPEQHEAMEAAASGFMNVFYAEDLESSLAAIDEFASPLVAASMAAELDLYWTGMPPPPGVTYDLANSWVDEAGPTSGYLIACGQQLFFDLNVTPERDLDVLGFELVRNDDRWMVDNVEALGSAPLAACEADTLDLSAVQ